MVSELLEPILEDLPFASGDRVLLFTNSMGGTPLIELYLAHGIAEQLLADRGIVVERRLVGPYVTSLEMQGMSLTLLRLDDELRRPVGRAGPHGRTAVGSLRWAARQRTWSRPSALPPPVVPSTATSWSASTARSATATTART